MYPSVTQMGRARTESLESEPNTRCYCLFWGVFFYGLPIGNHLHSREGKRKCGWVGEGGGALNTWSLSDKWLWGRVKEGQAKRKRRKKERCSHFLKSVKLMRHTDRWPHIKLRLVLVVVLGKVTHGHRFYFLTLFVGDLFTVQYFIFK